MGCHQRCTPQKTLGQRAQLRTSPLDWQSRNAVCAKLLRMGLKRGHKPPTAKPKIVSVPKRKPALLAAYARPVHKVASTRKPVVRQPKELTKSQLNAMLAEAAANTARLLR